MKRCAFKVFLSYARRDDQPGGELGKGGFEVWAPAVNLTLGDNWAHAQGKALEKADAMVVLLSPVRVAPDHVQREIDYARASR